MSGIISSVAALNSFAAPITGHGILPSYDQLAAWDLTRERYSTEKYALEDLMDCYKAPLFQVLNELPETPSTKILKRDLNNVVLAHIPGPVDPLEPIKDLTEILFRIIMYYHLQCFKGDSRVFKRVKPKLEETVQKVDDLKEVQPQNVNQERAMVLLRALKARPDKALHTEDCRKILEGSAGAALNPEVVRRAMRALAEIYSSKIVCEELNGSYRIRTSF